MAATAGVEVTPLTPTDVPAAVGVLARGMRDNPIHVAVLGPDPERRERLLGAAVRRAVAAMEPGGRVVRAPRR